MKFQHCVEELLVSPVPNYIILLGFTIGGVARGVAVGAIVTLISLSFTELRVHDLLVTLSIVFLTSVLFSLCGFINAIFANSFDDISIIPTFVLTPLIYLGGVFYSIDLLSGFWRSLSLFNPILYMVNTFRYGILGVREIDIFWSFFMVIIFTLGLFIYCLYLLKVGKGLRQ